LSFFGKIALVIFSPVLSGNMLAHSPLHLWDRSYQAVGLMRKRGWGWTASRHLRGEAWTPGHW
jgi:hypothetical protein